MLKVHELLHYFWKNDVNLVTRPIMYQTAANFMEKSNFNVNKLNFMVFSFLLLSSTERFFKMNINVSKRKHAWA